MVDPVRSLVTLDDISAARSRIASFVRRTPLLDAGLVHGHPLHLKCENMQPTGAFKIRGAVNMLLQLSAPERRRGVITYSSGNHGQAVACAARDLGIPAVIVMPTTAPSIKVDGTRRFGAEVIFEGTTSVERRVRAECEVAARGLVMIPPFDHEAIIAGQGTTGLELLEQLPAMAAVIVAIGGGGQASGVAAAVKQSNPDVRVIGVEPAGANAMQQSIAAQHPITIGRSESIADGLLPTRPGDVTFAHVRAFVDAVVTVSDEEIIDALAWLYYHARLVAEPSGAAAVAALLAAAALPHIPPSGPVVAIVSGGNVAPSMLAELIERSVAAR